MKKLFLTLALLVSLTACSTQRIVLDPNVPEYPTKSGVNHFWFWGLGQTRKIDPALTCGMNGVAAVETKDTFWSILATSFLGLVWAPRPYNVYCRVPSYTPRQSPSYRNYDTYGGYY